MEKTLEIQLLELREQIAQEIDAYKSAGKFQRGFPGTEEYVLDIAALIARGQYK